MNTGEILIYQNQNGNIKVDVRLEEETVWLTQDQMAQLFGKGRSTITEHIGNVFKEGELSDRATRRNFRLVRLEGNREVERDVDFAKTKDLHFFLGTSALFHFTSHNPFMIIGTFHPKIETQFSLF